MEHVKGAIFIGCSGWSYKGWKGPFYPEGIPDSKLLSYYFSKLSTVEINSSFYHLPLRKTFENWRFMAPDNFVFAVKGSRYITHNKKLIDCGEALARFFDRVYGLGDKMGPILFQLPPSIKIDSGRLESFLKLLPPSNRYTFEFRNPSWFHPEIYSLLSDFRAAFCIYELSGMTSPLELTTDFAYLRLHGPDGKYQGRYSHGQLAEWVARFNEWAGEAKDVYCYFDNDEKGFAAINAVELREMAA